MNAGDRVDDNYHSHDIVLLAMTTLPSYAVAGPITSKSDQIAPAQTPFEN